MKRVILSSSLLVGMTFSGTPLSWAQSAAQTNYTAKCQACHGPTGAGETPTGKILKVKTFNDSQVVSMTDAALAGVISTGQGKMPAYNNMYSNDQINDLVQYLHQLQTSLQSQ